MGPFRWFMRMAIVLAVVVVAGIVVVKLHTANSSPPPGSVPSVDLPSFQDEAFSYGFDFASQGESTGQGGPGAASVRHVLTSMPGIVEDTSIMDWGLPDPEPVPGQFYLSGIASRINYIAETGGTPVITLCAAPSWMTDGGGPNSAPTPSHYRAFAALAARIAASFPQVKYFVVWNEFKGFWNAATQSWAIRGYTTMYNDVYRAIKRVRPDALIGGPYAVTLPTAQPGPGNVRSTPHGPWGYLDQRTLNAISYWLAHKAGAQFIAVDGRDFPTTGAVTNPLAATEKYAAMDAWLRAQTSLPIWWMESYIQPTSSVPAGPAAAARVAALIQMASSGARVGMQWQPQQGEGLPDEGLWTASGSELSGQPTVLAQILPRVLAVLAHQVSIVPGQPFGVLVAKGSGGTIALNTTDSATTAVVGGKPLSLQPGQVSTSISNQ
jgi:hypothetical protein